MSIQRIDSNPRLSGAVIHGGLVYLSGQVPTDRSLDCAGQTREVLAKIDDLLARAGTDKTRLLSAQIWLKDIATDFSAMNEVWAAWLPQNSAPARATLQAPLASEDVLVEIMLTAALPE
ncbi:enamine deaminase RidA (YjgF/YER057c/UK114 family) [Ectopseudomonas oleovorans]|uniref:Enamine deaminase RidA (YjgF/YER057c/UK114 family) n=2 Tax=Pseudomonadaceae TaxID=135621 RepID=A0A397M2R4_ECTOL|nr:MULTISPECIES: RidA family protein [Pseudomonas]QMV63312.1 RidA family protein [Pseudomonas berkeleyensis]RIA19310.1 enamine deaminase RidA (YjgF/YER057c/UK114 family) [Pseudomonas oleovorans]WSO38770.1 RidA family protein [Pseudomonas berkeleyensis]